MDKFGREVFGGNYEDEGEYEEYDDFYDHEPPRGGNNNGRPPVGVPAHVMEAMRNAKARESADQARARGWVTDDDRTVPFQGAPSYGPGPQVNRQPGGGGGYPGPGAGGNGGSKGQSQQGGGKHGGGNQKGQNQPPQGGRDERGKQGQSGNGHGGGAPTKQGGFSPFNHVGGAKQGQGQQNRQPGGGMPQRGVPGRFDPKAGYQEPAVHRVVYRAVAGAAAILGYMLCSYMATLTFQLAFHNLALSGVLGIFFAIFLNALQRVFRTAENIDAGVIVAGVAGYAGEYLLVLTGMLVAGGYKLESLPMKTGTEPLNWLQFIIVAIIAGTAVFLPEPIGEYVVNGKFYWLGRRAGGSNKRK